MVAASKRSALYSTEPKNPSGVPRIQSAGRTWRSRSPGRCRGAKARCRAGRPAASRCSGGRTSPGRAASGWDRAGVPSAATSARRARPGARMPRGRPRARAASSSRNGGVAREVGAEHEHVDEVADQALGLGPRCGWRPGEPTTKSSWPVVAAEQRLNAASRVMKGVAPSRRARAATAAESPGREHERVERAAADVRIGGRGRSVGRSSGGRAREPSPPVRELRRTRTAPRATAAARGRSRRTGPAGRGSGGASPSR